MTTTAESYVEANPQLKDKLLEIQAVYDDFANVNVSKSIDCGPGWVPIILDCHQNLKLVFPEAKFVQIKEKFGGLRIYLAGYPTADSRRSFAVDALIRYSETRASLTCEECGTSDYKRNVYLRSGGWIHNYCDSCEAVLTKVKDAKLEDAKPRVKKDTPL